MQREYSIFKHGEVVTVVERRTVEQSAPLCMCFSIRFCSNTVHPFWFESSNRIQIHVTLMPSENTVLHSNKFTNIHLTVHVVDT